jgi:hypothetical protein
MSCHSVRLGEKHQLGVRAAVLALPSRRDVTKRELLYVHFQLACEREFGEMPVVLLSLLEIERVEDEAV